MTYVECPACGRKALSVATRCPHCGIAFPSQPLRRTPPPRRLAEFWPAVVGVCALVAGAALVAVVVPRLRSTRAPEAPAPSPPPASDSLPSPSAAETPLPSLAPRTDSVPRPAVTSAPAPGVAADSSAPTPSTRRTQRYARTWVNVRDARARAAPSVLVLDPGDEVVVDSLSRGWYRVLIDGRAAGYVHRSNLDPVPPSR